MARSPSPTTWSGLSERDAVLVDNDQHLERHLVEVNQLTAAYIDSARALDRLLNGANASPQELALLESIKEIEAQTLVNTSALITLRRSGEIAKAQALLLSQTSQGCSEWLKRINALIDYEEALIKSQLG